MIVELDRAKKILMLKWLKQGYIDTLDLPEAFKDGSYFKELLITSGTIPDNDIKA